MPQNVHLALEKTSLSFLRRVEECNVQLLTHKNEKYTKISIFIDAYRKIASSNTSRLEAHVGFFRLLMKGIFGPCVL